MTREETRSYDERRRRQRHAAAIDVNYRRDDTYLYCRTSNISELGVFLVTDVPAAPGTILELKFALPDEAEPLRVTGEVRWTVAARGGRQPGMGIRFVDPDPELQRRIRTLVRTIAYLE